jgi:hypothetical protein
MYVLDGPAIVSVPLLVADANRVFLGLTALMREQNLCFCDEVITELKRTARGEAPLVWVEGCAASRPHRGATYNFIIWVTTDYRDLVDETTRDTLASAAVYVVAQALALREAGQDVTVVSEDRLPKPTRASGHDACVHFGLRCLGLLDFLDEVDLAEPGVPDDELDWSNGLSEDE